MKLQKYILAVLGVLIYFVGSAAQASIANNWVFCPTCTTRSDFESAGKVWYGQKTGLRILRVGNPNTGVVWNLHLQSAVGGVPYAMNQGTSKVISSPVKVVDAYDILSEKRYGTNLTSVQDSYEDTAVEQDYHVAIIAHKKKLLLNPTQVELQSGGFDSFASYQGEDVCPAAWKDMTAADPGWANAMTALGSAFKAVAKGYFGHGPEVSFVFKNGDVATFENNPLAGDKACSYVKGTAKDRSGKSLPDRNGVPGGGGTGIPAGRVGTDPTKSWYQEGEDWLICSYSDGQLTGCYIQHLRPY